MWVGGQHYSPAGVLPGKIPATHCVQEAGWAQGPVLKSVEKKNLARTEFRSAKHPGHSESLSRQICEMLHLNRLPDYTRCMTGFHVNDYKWLDKAKL